MMPSATARFAEEETDNDVKQIFTELTIRKYCGNCKIERNYGQTIEKQCQEQNDRIDIRKHGGDDQD